MLQLEKDSGRPKKGFPDFFVSTKDFWNILTIIRPRNAVKNGSLDD